MKDINFAELRALVEKQLKEFDGGIMSPDIVPFVPHRQPAADPPRPPRAEEYSEADELYDVAFVAREATEKLVEALDDPSYDDAFEHAFRASACLRRTLNALIGAGAKPQNHQIVVAPRKSLQKYFGKRQGGDQFKPPFSSDAGMVESQNLQEVDKEEAESTPKISLPKRLMAIGGISDAADYITTVTSELLRIKNSPEQLEEISVFDSKFLYLTNQLVLEMVLAKGIDLEGNQLEIERALEDFKRDLEGVINVKFT